MAPAPPTHRQRILHALRREPVDCLPWVPRLDLWYKANLACGTLPPQWAGASLRDITRDLGVGTHAVIPDFLDVEEPDQAADRALGIDHVPNRPARVSFNRVRRVVQRAGDRWQITYRLPRGGELTAVLRYDEAMRRSGATLMHIEEPLIKSLADYDLVGDLFEDLVVQPDDRRYQKLAAEVGEDGVVVALGSVAASPVHLLLKELVPFDRFIFDLYDHPEVVARTAQRLEGYFAALLEACVASPAELVLWGANYDLMTTAPPFFAEHIAPWLTRVSEALHQAGKLLVTHTDGENEQLNPYYVASGVDVADSVCPAPMTRLSLADYRRDFAAGPAIWGGLCSVCVLPEVMSEAQFEAHLEAALAAAGEGRGLIFSLADTTPPAASVDRLRRIGERVAAFGPVW